MLSATDLLAVGEVSDGAFLGYIAALAVSGILLLILAAVPFLKQSVGMRVVDALIGLAFLGYAFYLFFIFDGGEFRMFYYAFVVPIILIIQAVRQSRTRTAT